jgi:hypothetical protein
MYDANNKVVDYLYRALCQAEFDRVQTDDFACRIWEQLKNAHAGNSQVHVRLLTTYRREYENLTHLPDESIDAMLQWFTIIVNNMRANVAAPPYGGHDKSIMLLHSLDCTVWIEKVKAILESEKYETLMVDELFSSSNRPRWTVGCEQGSRTRLTIIVWLSFPDSGLMLTHPPGCTSCLLLGPCQTRILTC